MSGDGWQVERLDVVETRPTGASPDGHRPRASRFPLVLVGAGIPLAFVAWFLLLDWRTDHSFLWIIGVGLVAWFIISTGFGFLWAIWKPFR
jgi:hypothetical protein